MEYFEFRRLVTTNFVVITSCQPDLSAILLSVQGTFMLIRKTTIEKLRFSKVIQLIDEFQMSLSAYIVMFLEHKIKIDPCSHAKLEKNSTIYIIITVIS